MSTLDEKTLGRINYLVRSAATNILEVMETLKEMKTQNTTTQPTVGVDLAQPGEDQSVQQVHVDTRGMSKYAAKQAIRRAGARARALHPGPGKVDIVIKGEHGITVMGNVDPEKLPRWHKVESESGDTYTTLEAQRPELQRNRHRHNPNQHMHNFTPSGEMKPSRMPKRGRHGAKSRSKRNRGR